MPLLLVPALVLGANAQVTVAEDPDRNTAGGSADPVREGTSLEDYVEQRCDFKASLWCRLETVNSFHDVAWPHDIEGRPSGCCHDPVGVFRDFNGMAFDGTSAYFHGGGHGGYAGNEVYELELTTLTWSRLIDPAPLTDTETFNEVCPIPEAEDGPYSGHTYGTPVVYDDTLHVWSIYAKCDGGKTRGTPQKGAFDLTRNEWRPREFTDNAISATAYVGDGEVIIFGAHANPPVYRYALASEEIVRRGEAPREWIRFGTAATGEGFVALRDKDNLHLIDPDTLNRIRSVSVPSGAGTNGGIDYYDGRWYLWRGTSAVWSIDAGLRGEWQVHEGDGPSPSAHHVFSKWRYVDSADVFLGVSKKGEPLWLFRPH